MGFFTKIKKILGGGSTEQAQEIAAKEQEIIAKKLAAKEQEIANTQASEEQGQAELTQKEYEIKAEVSDNEISPTLQNDEQEDVAVQESSVIDTVLPLTIEDNEQSAVNFHEENLPLENLSFEDLLVEELPLEESPLDQLSVQDLPKEIISHHQPTQESLQQNQEEPPKLIPQTENKDYIGEQVNTPELIHKAEQTPLPPQEEIVKTSTTLDIDGLSAEDQAHLSQALRGVEPRLSAWLGIVLEGISEVKPLLWLRLRYLLQSLDAQASEALAFVDDFRAWLERMEYEYVEEFRSELQYRLALALDLEDEEDERNRLFIKLSDGLARTREQFTRKLDALFASHGALNAEFWEEMEELLIMADVGFDSSMQLIQNLKDGVRKQGLSQPEDLRGLLQEELEKIFDTPKRITSFPVPEVIMMVGVNGVGKTTTIAKLAHRDRMQGKKVLIAAADTFRAAATEQLGVWAQRVGADFHRKQTGADPAAVAYESMDIALRNGYDVLYIDTAGRLQTKVNLMEELKKIRQVIGKKHASAPHRSILVIDATTGQNALSQTKIFNEATGVDEIILSKLDGTAKGGVAIAVAMQHKIPITYVGLGEKLEDLRPFNGRDFALALLGVQDQPKS